MSHIHDIYDTDRHFVIDPVTREITYSESDKLILIQNDHNSERFTFEIPKIIEGHDMSSCDKVEIHYLNKGVSGGGKKILVFIRLKTYRCLRAIWILRYSHG